MNHNSQQYEADMHVLQTGRTESNILPSLSTASLCTLCFIIKSWELMTLAWLITWCTSNELGFQINRSSSTRVPYVGLLAVDKQNGTCIWALLLQPKQGPKECSSVSLSLPQDITTQVHTSLRACPHVATGSSTTTTHACITRVLHARAACIGLHHKYIRATMHIRTIQALEHIPHASVKVYLNYRHSLYLPHAWSSWKNTKNWSGTWPTLCSLGNSASVHPCLRTCGALPDRCAAVLKW